MQHLLSTLAAAGALATATPSTDAIATNSPIVVSTCAVTDLSTDLGSPEFGPPITSRWLQLSFTNTDDTVATQVAFDVVHGGDHTMVTDRGRFSKGALIEHTFNDDFVGYDRSADSCTVAAITFADGRRWTAPRSAAPAPATTR